MHWFIRSLKHYAVFEGRSCRKEYWLFQLFAFIVVFLMAALSGGLQLAHIPGGDLLLRLMALVLIAPSIAVGVRRMHDVDRSGWWLLVPVFGVLFSVLPGTSGPNRFGVAPSKQPQAPSNLTPGTRLL